MSMSILGTTVSGELVAAMVACMMAGMCVPFRYGIERLRGFGRAMVSKLPYQPPPGKEEGEAMAEATESDGSASTSASTSTAQKRDGDGQFAEADSST